MKNYFPKRQIALPVGIVLWVFGVIWVFPSFSINIKDRMGELKGRMGEVRGRMGEVKGRVSDVGEVCKTVFRNISNNIPSGHISERTFKDAAHIIGRPLYDREKQDFRYWKRALKQVAGDALTLEIQNMVLSMEKSSGFSNDDLYKLIVPFNILNLPPLTKAAVGHVLKNNSDSSRESDAEPSRFQESWDNGEDFSSTRQDSSGVNNQSQHTAHELYQKRNRHYLALILSNYLSKRFSGEHLTTLDQALHQLEIQKQMEQPLSLQSLLQIIQVLESIGLSYTDIVRVAEELNLLNLAYREQQIFSRLIRGEVRDQDLGFSPVIGSHYRLNTFSNSLDLSIGDAVAFPRSYDSANIPVMVGWITEEHYKEEYPALSQFQVSFFDHYGNVLTQAFSASRLARPPRQEYEWLNYMLQRMRQLEAQRDDGSESFQQQQHTRGGGEGFSRNDYDLQEIDVRLQLCKELSISSTSSDQEIIQAYRRMANRHHPDKNFNDSSSVGVEIFKRISSLYRDWRKSNN